MIHLLIGTDTGEIMFIENFEFRGYISPGHMQGVGVEDELQPVLCMAPDARGFVVGTNLGRLKLYERQEDLKEKYSLEDSCVLPGERYVYICIYISHLHLTSPHTLTHTHTHTHTHISHTHTHRPGNVLAFAVGPDDSLCCATGMYHINTSCITLIGTSPMDTVHMCAYILTPSPSLHTLHTYRQTAITGFEPFKPHRYQRGHLGCGEYPDIFPRPKPSRKVWDNRNRRGFVEKRDRHDRAGLHRKGVECGRQAYGANERVRRGAYWPLSAPLWYVYSGRFCREDPNTLPTIRGDTSSQGDYSKTV
jgi:hypothetical protein